MGHHDQLVQPLGEAHGGHDSESSEAGDAQGCDGSVPADISRRHGDQQDDHVFHEVEGLRSRHGQESPRCGIHDHEVGDGEGLSIGTWEYAMSLQDQHHRLLTICPPEIRRIILRDLDEDDFADYESLKQEILDRVNQELEEVQGKPAINGVEERREGDGHTETAKKNGRRSGIIPK